MKQRSRVPSILGLLAVGLSLARPAAGRPLEAPPEALASPSRRSPVVVVVEAASSSVVNISTEQKVENPFHRPILDSFFKGLIEGGVAPPDSGDARDCFQDGLPPARCGRPVTVHWRSYAYAEWKAAGTAARFVDSRPWFCLSEKCPALVGSLPVMFDGQHLTGAYAARIAPLLSDALR